MAVPAMTTAAAAAAAAAATATAGLGARAVVAGQWQGRQGRWQQQCQ